MSVFAGLPSFLALLSTLYLLAEFGNRWAMIAFALGGLVWLAWWFRNEARR